MRRAFTLVEMIVSFVLLTGILLVAFGALSGIGIQRTKVSSQIDFDEDFHSATELLVKTIQDGGHLDYEEYWNRAAVGMTMSGGHYIPSTGFGNFGSGGVINATTTTYGDGFYFCRSGNNASMGTGGCLTNFNSYGTTSNGQSASLAGQPQRYGEYAFQFIDMNSDKNDDGANCASRSVPVLNKSLGDTNCDGEIRGDDDDENLGMGPLAFTGGVGLKELYLIKTSTTNERTLFRYIIRQDTSVPKTSTGGYMYICDPQHATGALNNGCIGNIQMLRLLGRDLGMAHSGSVVSFGRYDGAIDTWICDPSYTCTHPARLPTGADNEWVDIFPSYVNVEDMNFFAYPPKDPHYAWKETDPSISVSPIVRIQLRLGYGWVKRAKINTPTPEISITTSVNLSQ